MKTLALISAGCQDARLGVLVENRADAAVPFAGKYRVIDFVLSNCANSGIVDVGILTQYHPHALSDHVGTGKPWDLDRSWSGGVTLLMPYQRDGGLLNWYRGSADAVFQNLDYVLEQKAENVLFLPGEQIYKMNYALFLDFHRYHRADVTICVTSASQGSRSQLGYLLGDESGRVKRFHARPLNEPGCAAIMGLFAFRTDALLKRLTQDSPSRMSTHDFRTDVLPRMLELGDRLFVYRFDDYWVNVDSAETYWESNMCLLQSKPPLNLQDRDWSIQTRYSGRPPVSIYPGATVSNSLVADGCIIHGQVENSVLSPGVSVKAGAFVMDSVILHDCEIGANAIVHRAVLDQDVVVGENAIVGENGHSAAFQNHGHGAEPDITLVAQNTHLPAGFWLGKVASAQSMLPRTSHDPLYSSVRFHADRGV